MLQMQESNKHVLVIIKILGFPVEITLKEECKKKKRKLIKCSILEIKLLRLTGAIPFIDTYHVTY